MRSDRPMDEHIDNNNKHRGITTNILTLSYCLSLKRDIIVLWQYNWYDCCLQFNKGDIEIWLNV